MQWGQIIDINPATSDDDAHSAEELLFAQLTGVRMVMFLGKHSTLDDDDWHGLFAWLGMTVPNALEDSRLYSDYAPMLKQWWQRATAEVDPQAPITTTLTLLCDHLADLLQLQPLEEQLLTLAWLWMRHPQMSPILTSMEESRAKKLLAQLTNHGSDEVEGRAAQAPSARPAMPARPARQRQDRTRSTPGQTPGPRADYRPRQQPDG